MEAAAGSNSLWGLLFPGIQSRHNEERGFFVSVGDRDAHVWKLSTELGYGRQS